MREQTGIEFSRKHSSNDFRAWKSSTRIPPRGSGIVFHEFGGAIHRTPGIEGHGDGCLVGTTKYDSVIPKITQDSQGRSPDIASVVSNAGSLE